MVTPTPGDVAPIRQAFFPGYPSTLRVLSELYTGATDEQGLHLAAFTVTTISSFIATVLVYRLAAERLDRRAGALAALLLMAWPSATFLTIYYSEALYLALATAAWYCATRGWWWAAGLLCAGASFTRINGVFLVAALLVMLLVAVHRGQERFGWSKLLAVATGFVGAAVYQLHLWRLTGDLFAWSHAQTKGWGQGNGQPVAGADQHREPFRRADHRQLHACAAGGRHRRRGLRMRGDRLDGRPALLAGTDS